MKSTFSKICIIFLSFMISFSAYGHGTIIFPNVEHDEGFIDVKIYDSKESFLDEDLAIESVRKRVKKGEVVVPLSKIHEGKIAIVAYHDEDSNGKLLSDIVSLDIIFCLSTKKVTQIKQDKSVIIITQNAMNVFKIS